MKYECKSRHEAQNLTLVLKNEHGADEHDFTRTGTGLRERTHCLQLHIQGIFCYGNSLHRSIRSLENQKSSKSKACFLVVIPSI